MREVEDNNKEEVSKIPNLELAQWLFLINQAEYDPKKKKEAQEKLMAAVKENQMAPFYKDYCDEFKITPDRALLDSMEKANKEKLEALEATISDATENLGETEVRDAYYKKAMYLCTIGDKEDAVTTLKQTYEKTVGVGKRIDLVFLKIRVGLFYTDHQLVSTNLIKAKELMEQGGDWDRKNRLKAYEGLYALSIRDFKKAADLFLDAVSTFTSYELMTYEQLVFYTVISSMLALDRPHLRTKVIRGAEIQEQLHGQKDVLNYLTSFYDCDYAGFFRGLSAVEPRLKFDRYLSPHYVYYNRAMRTKAYKQLLSSYRSLTLQYMADAFDVTVEYIDKELHQLIATGALHCKIDSVRGVVETSQLDGKNGQYQAVIKHGDILLNRVQKLSRVINT